MAPLPAQDGKDTRYNQETVAIMRRVMTPTANGVDVGAYKGALTKPMLKIAPRGTHIAVEPQPAYARRLRKRFPKVRVLEVALGDTMGTVEFVQALDSPARSGFRRTEYPTARERTRTISVRVERLDDLVAPTAPLSFIKIDVEGAEYQVLRGAKATIQRDRPVIVFEYGRAGRQDYGIEPAAMWQLLHIELGMEISLMRDWLDGRPAFTETDFTRMVGSGVEWMFVAHPAQSSTPSNGAPR
ncbi:MAG: FkbM family methyltransferase [Gemmatimonadota bacterium]|nr:FkbM family methyltransferase [Gemmatimonadota bacterium]